MTTPATGGGSGRCHSRDARQTPHSRRTHPPSPPPPAESPPPPPPSQRCLPVPCPAPRVRQCTLAHRHSGALLRVTTVEHTPVRTPAAGWTRCRVRPLSHATPTAARSANTTALIRVVRSGVVYSAVPFTALKISLDNFVLTADFFASASPFWCLILLHLEWPAKRTASRVHSTPAEGDHAAAAGRACSRATSRCISRGTESPETLDDSVITWDGIRRRSGQFDLASIRELDYSCCGVKEVENLEPCVSLTRASLSGNRVRWLPPAVPAVPGTAAHTSSITLQIRSVGCLTAMPLLEVLDLSNNLISSLGARWGRDPVPCGCRHPAWRCTHCRRLRRSHCCQGAQTAGAPGARRPSAVAPVDVAVCGAGKPARLVGRAVELGLGTYLLLCACVAVRDAAGAALPR